MESAVIADYEDLYFPGGKELYVCAFLRLADVRPHSITAGQYICFGTSIVTVFRGDQRHPVL
jgi:hypothetical protein